MRNKYKIVAMLFLATILSTIVMTETAFAAEPPATTMHKIEDIFRGSFSPSEVTAIADETFDVDFTIHPTIDAPGTTVHFILPADLVTLVNGDATWQGDLEKGEKLTLSLSLRTEGEVEAYVRANVEASSLGEDYRNSYYLHVVVPMTEEAKHGVRTVKSESLPATRSPESPRVEVTPQAPASPGNIEVKGSWWYVNDEGGWSPGRYMLVELWDDDTGSDEFVASQWTGANGEFDFIVNNDDGFLQWGRDPYLLFHAEGAWDWITTDTNGNRYSWGTGVLGEDVPDGWVHDTGSIAPGSSNNALMAGDAVFAEMNWVYWNSGVNWERSKITVRWPRETWAHSHGDYIDLQTSGWDHVTVYHETGHCVQWTLYGNSWPNGAIFGDHWITMEWSNMPAAFAEGWAGLMEAVVDNDPNNYQAGGHNIETNDWFNHQDTGDMDGAYIEGEVASIMWDIWDPVNIAGDNDHMAWGYEEIFTVMHYGDAGADDNPNNMFEFWDDWASRWPTNSTSMGPLCDIYYQYGIDEDWFNPWGNYIYINSGVTYTTSRTVTLSISADDWGVGVKYMQFSEDGVTWGGWYNYATTFSYTIASAGDGYKRVYVRFADFWWLSTPIYDSIYLDTVAPTGSVSINYGATYATSRTVTLVLSGSDATSGVGWMRFSENMGAWTQWYPYATTHSCKLNSTGEGYKSIDVQFMDYAGLTSTLWAIWDSITLDTMPPNATIIINSGNPPYTNTTSVTLYLTYSDSTSGVYQVRYGNGGGTWGAWEAPAATKAWTLISGDGSKSVWYEVKDNAGNVCPQVGDYITLDTVAPTAGSLLINSGNTYTTSRSVTLTLSATDATSGVAQMRFSENFGAWSSWVAYATTYSFNLVSAGEGSKSVDVQFKDGAGNPTVMWTIYDYIYLDTVAPTGSVIINGGAATTTTTAVTLSLTYSDAGSGVKQVRYGNTGEPYGAWEAPAATKAWTLTSGDGTKTVWYQIMDNAGLISTYTDTIILQTPAAANAYLVVRGADSRMWYKTYSGGAWGSWNALPGATIDSPAAAVCNNELHVVVRGSDGITLWHGYVDLASSAFSGWTLLDGSTPSAPTLTSNGTVLSLVVRGGGNSIWYRTYSFSPSRSWGGWNAVTGATIDSPAAAMLGNNLHVVVRGSDGNTLWHIVLKPNVGVVRNWILLSGSTPSKPTLTANQTANTLYLAVRGASNQIFWRTYNGGTDSWAGWNLVPTGTTVDTPAVTVVDNKLQIVVRDMSGTALYHGNVDLSTSAFSGWTLLSGSTPSAPTLTT